jgi:hypothetical protein
MLTTTARNGQMQFREGPPAAPLDVASIDQTMRLRDFKRNRIAGSLSGRCT